jgi:predicted MFS family arabinose efflux permease
MAGLKAANLWFDRERLPAINALLFGMTGLGGMLATGPLAYMLRVIDWRTAMLMICVYCCAIAIVSAMMIPSVRQTGPAPRLASQIADIGRLYRSPIFLRFAPITVAAIAGYSSYQSLWAAIWLRDLEGFGRDAQAWALFTLMGAMMVGNFAFGAINARLRARGISTLNAALSAMALMMVLQAIIVLDILPSSLPLWIVMALCTSGPIAMFAVLSQRFPPELAGRTNTALNVLAFLAGFLVQSGIGFLLDRFPVSADGGYDPGGHRLALGIIVLIQVAAFAWFFLSARFDRSNRSLA